MEETDAELIAAYQAGEEHAFATLVERHLRRVYSFVARSVREDVDDLVQEIFLKVWKNLDTYQSETAQFPTWLMRITRNTVIDHLRKKRAIAWSDLAGEDGESFLSDIPDDAILPDELAARGEDVRQLETFLADLPLLYREVILLRDMNHLSFDAVAEALGAPLNTVKSRYRRGVLELRKRFDTLHPSGE